jgi:8-oxo-dGTP diphosphatase
MSTIHYIVNVEVVIVRDGRYLMMIRSEQEDHAPGTLSFPGGKVEDAGDTLDVLEETARREAMEEAGVVVGELAYSESKSFVPFDEFPVVDIVFLGKHESGEPTPGDPEEVASVEWMTVEEILGHPKCPDWTNVSIRKAEALRSKLGW